MKTFGRSDWEKLSSIIDYLVIDRTICFGAVMPDGVTALFYSTIKRVNNLVYQKNILLRWLLPFVRAPPFDLKIRHFQIKRRLLIVAYNHNREFTKFINKWKLLRKEYKKAGMSDEAIEKIYLFDLNLFNRDRAYYEHLCSEPLNDGSDEDIFVLEGKLKIKEQDFIGYSRFWWVEEIENPMLAAFVKSLSHEDMELVTMAYFEGYSQDEIGKRLGLTQQAVSKRLAKFEKIKENIKNF